MVRKALVLLEAVPAVVVVVGLLPLNTVVCTDTQR